MIDEVQMGDILTPDQEDAFARLLEVWRGFLDGVQHHHSRQAAISAMMLVAMQAQEESAGSERLADTLEGLAATVRSKAPRDGSSAAMH